MRQFVCVLVMLIAAGLATSVAMAQAGEPSVSVVPPVVSPGQAVVLEVRVPLGPGLHLYGPQIDRPYIATALAVSQPGPVDWSKAPEFPPVAMMEFMEQELAVLEPDPETGAVTLRLGGRVKGDATAGEHAVSVKVTYQACTKDRCYLPVRNRELAGTVTISTTDVVGGVSGDTGVPMTMVSVELDGQGPSPVGFGSRVAIFGWDVDLQALPAFVPLLIALLAGLILNIMPCVLPVIPLKVLQLVKDAQQHERSAFWLALSFSGGILLFFLAIGVVAVMLQQAFVWGQQFYSPTFLIGTALLLVGLALGMFDVFEIRVPNFVAGLHPRAGAFVGALGMGVLAGVLSTPCSFGILGAAIAWAQTQSAPLTLLTFLMIGVGMGLPYVLLASRPALVGGIPAAGRWSEIFKQAMGFLLLAVAAFLVTALPEERILAVLFYILLFSFVIWLWGKLWLARSDWAARAWKLAAIGVLVAAGAWMLGPQEERLGWREFDSAALEAAEGSGKPYLVKFTADWCVNCKTVEYRVFRNGRVIEALGEGEVMLLRADPSAQEMAAEKLLEWTGQTGIPFTVVFVPGKAPVLLAGVYSPGDLLDALGAEQAAGR